MYTENNVWEKVSKNWDRITPPFRPHEQDVTFMAEVLKSEDVSFEANRILLLGVTPELATLEIPEDCEMIAVDNNEAMIENVWPKMPDPNKKVIFGDWLDMPFEPNSCDIILGDGVFAPMRYPDQARQLLRTVRDLLHPEGLFIFRIFLNNEEPENPGSVLDAVLNGEIKTEWPFKFRLMRSVQTDTSKGSALNNVWKFLTNEGPGFESLTEKTGWPIQTFQSFQLYEGSDVVITYPKLSEIRELFKDENFEEVKCFTPTYELGEYCRTFVLRAID